MLQEFKDKIRNMSAEEFEKHRKSLIINYREKDYNIYQEGQRCWLEILKFRYFFDKKERKALIAEELARTDVENYYEKLFFTEPRRLEIHMVSLNHLESNTKLETEMKNGFNPHLKEKFDSVQKFKRIHHLYPDFYSYI
jgi:secreted Zn-dependent insulinase-like peptidase